MNDCEHIQEVSGANGRLAKSAELCHALNERLTSTWDTLFGPDATDAHDASCNTCTHFQRTPFDRKERPISIFGFPGTCAKTGDSVTGWPRGQFCGHSCYENRRTQQVGPVQHFHKP